VELLTSVRDGLLEMDTHMDEEPKEDHQLAPARTVSKSPLDWFIRELSEKSL
jgi:hypothetical protein